jgi:hypothetical protein
MSGNKKKQSLLSSLFDAFLPLIRNGNYIGKARGESVKK